MMDKHRGRCRSRSINIEYAQNSGDKTMKHDQEMRVRALQAGFTLIELLVSVAVVGVLLTIAIPSLRDLSLGSATVSRTNDLLGHLNTARAEAVKTATNVRISAVDGNWNNGWIVAVDRNMNGAVDDGDGDRVLQEGTKLKTGFNWIVAKTPGGGAITELFYTASGTLSTTNAGARFKLERPDASDHPERCKIVAVQASGRAEGQKGSAAQCAA
jgi:type IV fimbrial biogenesis protein FimT